MYIHTNGKNDLVGYSFIYHSHAVRARNVPSEPLVEHVLVKA